MNSSWKSFCFKCSKLLPKAGGFESLAFISPAIFPRAGTGGGFGAVDVLNPPKFNFGIQPLFSSGSLKESL